MTYPFRAFAEQAKQDMHAARTRGAIYNVTWDNSGTKQSRDEERAQALLSVLTNDWQGRHQLCHAVAKRLGVSPRTLTDASYRLINDGRIELRYLNKIAHIRLTQPRPC